MLCICALVAYKLLVTLKSNFAFHIFFEAWELMRWKYCYSFQPQIFFVAMKRSSLRPQVTSSTTNEENVRDGKMYFWKVVMTLKWLSIALWVIAMSNQWYAEALGTTLWLVGAIQDFNMFKLSNRVTQKLSTWNKVDKVDWNQNRSSDQFPRVA